MKCRLFPGLNVSLQVSNQFVFYSLSGCLVATAVGNKLLEDEDTISPTQKRIERNSHDHGHEGHGHGHHGEDGVDILDFFQAAGVRLTDGKDREGADDLGNGNFFSFTITYRVTIYSFDQFLFVGLFETSLIS